MVTKVDLLCNQGDRVAKSRVGKIVRETKQPKVASGAGQCRLRTSAEDEARSLASVSDMLAQCGGEIQAGCAELGGLIEARMREHLERQLPELHMVVIAARDAKSARKNYLLVCEPDQLVLKVMGNVRNALRKDEDRFVAFLRDQRDVNAVGIKSALRLHSKSCRACREQHGQGRRRRRHPRRAHVGAECWNKKKNEDAPFIRATIMGVMLCQAHAEIELTDGETAKVDRDSLPIKDDPPSCNTSRSSCGAVRAFEISHKSTAARHRGRRGPLGPDVRGCSEAAAINDFARRVVAEAFARSKGQNAEQCTELAVELRKRSATAGVDDLCRDADKCVRKVIRYVRPPLVFTTNEHYLASVFEKMIADLDGKPHRDERPAQIMHAQWLAFRKVQSKVIIESTSLSKVIIESTSLASTCLTLTRSFTASFWSANIDPKVVDSVFPEPSSLERKRERVVKELAKLKRTCLRRSRNGPFHSYDGVCVEHAS